MISEPLIQPASTRAGPARFARRIAVGYLFCLTCLASATVLVLVHDGRRWVFAIALAAAASFLGLEYLEGRYGIYFSRGGNGWVIPVSLIVLTTAALYFPTRNIYFLGDDFGCLHAFHNPSLQVFLNMFHTDLSHVVEGETGQEIRPFYALYYMMSYTFWGLNPSGYHFISILVDIVNALIVFCIANELAPGNTWRAGIAGLLFAVQPLDAKAISWITGAPAEEVPAMFYLAAFLCFMRYRATNRSRYLWASVFAFAAILMCKEIAVTLPVMLLCYDLFSKRSRKWGIVDRPGIAPHDTAAGSILIYLPFALLLIVYLVWRHIVFSHFLGENFWADSLGITSMGRIASPEQFLHLCVEFSRYLAGHFAFELRALLLALPTLSLGLALGLYLTWSISFPWKRSESAKPLAIALFFGVVWYVISDAPLLVAAPEARHLYLLAAGPCIATAFLAFPDSFVRQKNGGYLRLLEATLLVGILGCQLWRGNREFVQAGARAAHGIPQIAATMKTIPAQALVMIAFPDKVFLPFALQAPFTSKDLYSPAHIIESPEMAAFPFDEWSMRTRDVLESEMAGAKDAPMEIDLLAWDDRSQSMQLRKRILSKGLFRDCVTQSLGAPVGSLNALSGEQADELLNTLATLAQQGG